MESKWKGIFEVILSAVAFGLMPLLSQGIYDNGGTPASTAFCRFSLTLPLLWCWLRIHKIPLKVSLAQWKSILLITVLGYGGTAVLLLVSYQYLPGGMATTIHFGYPVFVILGELIFFRERADRNQLICAALCMAGILLFYDGGTSGNLLGIGLAFASGLTYAYYIVALERSSLKELPPLKMIFYMNLTASAVLLLSGVFLPASIPHLKPAGWGYALLMSFLISFAAVFLFQRGVRSIGPKNAALLSTFEPMTSLAVGIVLFGELLTPRLAAGCVLILVSVVIVGWKQSGGKGEAFHRKK